MMAPELQPLRKARSTLATGGGSAGPLHDGLCRCRVCKPGFAPMAVHAAAPAVRASRIEVAAYALCAGMFVMIAARVAQVVS